MGNILLWNHDGTRNLRKFINFRGAAAKDSGYQADPHALTIGTAFAYLDPGHVKITDGLRGIVN